MAHPKSDVRLIASRFDKRNGSLGMPKCDLFGVLRALEAGLPFGRLLAFAAKSGLAQAEIAGILRIPPRTLARRKTSGILTDLESERLVRLAGLFDQAVDLFEGDASAATAWLRAPAKALGHKTPLELAKTEIGARAVEDLIGRLEFGVYS